MRSENGKIVRRLHPGDIGVTFAESKCVVPRTDNLCGTVTTVDTDNWIMIETKMDNDMEYKPNPTKQDLLEYFSKRCRIRKLTDVEAMRLMDVDDESIQKIKDAGVARTSIKKMAGNSIVVSCLYHIFRTMFIADQPENLAPRQLTLF